MSRIILSTYPNGESQFVVGWDRPCASFFWQEFNKEPEPTKSGRVDYPDDWEEMLRFKGYMPNELPTMQTFMESLPAEFRDLVTPEVQERLRSHVMDPNCGNIMVNMVGAKP